MRELVGGDTVSVSGLGAAVGMDNCAPVRDARSDRMFARRQAEANGFIFVREVEPRLVIVANMFWKLQKRDTHQQR